MSGRYLSAQEACRQLGIKPQSLYAYVSRGQIRSEASSSGAKRSRRYHRVDVERLKRRGEIRAHPERAAEGALSAGDPVLESQLTLIDDDGLYYRGVSVMDLAVDRTVEEVAALLWAGDVSSKIVGDERVTPSADLLRRLKGLASLDMIERCQALLPIAASRDPAALDLSPQSVIRTGVGILRLMTAIATETTVGAGAVARVLQRVWAPEDEQAAGLINAALILCADHELNVSTFAARCVASSGANLYAVVNAGLSALQGSRHGGASDRVEAFWREAESADTAAAAVAARLKRGELLHGFGHAVYRGVDPRARLLLDLTSRAYPESRAVSVAGELIDAVGAASEHHYNLDLAMVTMRQAMGLAPGTPIVIFALGRTIGWIGHAIEQYQTGRLIRPRARYTGPLPG